MPATMTEQQRIKTLNADLAAFTKGLQAALPTFRELAHNLYTASQLIQPMLPSIASAAKGLNQAATQMEQAAERMAQTTGFSRQHWMEALQQLQRSEELRQHQPVTPSELQNMQKQAATLSKP